MRALVLKLAFALVLLGTGYAAQDAPERSARQSARERWEAMTPAEQNLMRKRFFGIVRPDEHDLHQATLDTEKPTETPRQNAA